jgi:hypothetical protein
MLPDEHAARAVDVLHAVIHNTKEGFQYEPWIEPTAEAISAYQNTTTGMTTEAARRDLRMQTAAGYVKQTYAGTDSMVRFSSGLNASGNIILMPSQSRVVLASIGAYRVQPQDQVTALPKDKRVWYATDAYRTIVHELQHTVTPAPQTSSEIEHQRVLEEAAATVMEGWLWQGVKSRAKADLNRAAQPPRSGYVSGGVEWDAWNNGRLPDAPRDLEASKRARYVGGPVLLRRIFSLAGYDLRTSADRSKAIAALQGGSIEQMPTRLAHAIAQGRGITSPAAKRQLAETITNVAGGKAPISELDEARLPRSGRSSNE